MNTSSLPIQQIVDKDLQFMKLNDVALGTHAGYKTFRRKSAKQDGAPSGLLDQRQFSIIPSLGAISSKPYLYYKLPLRILGGAGAGNDLKAGGNAGDPEAEKNLRRINKLRNKLGTKPICANRMNNSVEVSINKKPFTTNHIAKECDLMSVSETRAVLSEISPSFKADNCADFNALTDTSRNVLHWGVDLPPGDEFTSRGASGNNFRVVYDGSGEAGNGYVDVTFYIKEALVARPLQYRELSPNPLFDVDTLDIKIIYNANPFQWLLAMANPTWTATNQPNGQGVALPISVNILYDEYQLSDLLPKPTEALVYNAPKIEYQEYPETAPIVAGATGQWQSQTYRKTGVPSMVAVCLVDRNYDQNYHVPHRTLEIEQIAVRVNNEDDKLVDLNNNPERLYELSRDNGYNLSLSNFTNSLYDAGAVGSNASNGWFLFKVSDFGTASQYLQSNVYSEFTVEFHIAWKNSTGVDFANGFLFKMHLIYDEVLVKQDRMYTIESALIPANRLLESVGTAPLVYDGDKSKNVLGGNKFFNMLKRGFNRVRDFVKNPKTKQAIREIRNLPGISDVVGDSTTAGRVANTLGYGAMPMGSGMNHVGMGVNHVGRGKKAPAKRSKRGGKAVSEQDLLSQL